MNKLTNHKEAPAMKCKINMPIGVDDFKEIITKGYYCVDKTRFIKDLIDGHSKVTLITRPRRFGKTLTMSMLRYFFTLENAEENRALFTGLDIERAGNEYMAEQGTRPVVFITLKDIRENNYASMIKSISLLMQKLYRPFDYLMDSKALIPAEKKFFNKVSDGEAEPETLQFTISSLMEFLCRHHGKKALLLIDEYDAPIQTAWEAGYYDEAIAFFRNFYGAALKTNPALDFALLTGVLRISKESIFSALNNIEVSSVIKSRFPDAMGFTRDEVIKMATDLGHADKIAEIREWYDGYNFSGIEIYNPWSVINYFQMGCDPVPYWVHTSGNSILNTLLSHIDDQRKDDLVSLMNGEPITAILDETVLYPEIERSSTALYMMLVTSGYLKCISQTIIDGEIFGKLVIPNKEVRTLFKKEIVQHATANHDSYILYNMLNAMLSGNAQKFESLLTKILRENAGIHDMAYPEAFYNGLFLGFSMLLSGTYDVASNGESGYGRFDLAFIPFAADKPGVILELKRADSEDRLDAKITEAISQIEEKEYISVLEKRGVGTIWKYGIAFCGKKVKMLRG